LLRRSIIPPADEATQKEDDQSDRGRIGHPVQRVAVGVMRGNLLENFVDGPKDLKGSAEVERFGLRIGERPQRPQGKEGSDMLDLVGRLTRKLRRMRDQRHDESDQRCCPEGEMENRGAADHRCVLLACHLDEEGLGWGDVLAREAAMFTPTLPSPVEGEEESFRK
jgi:hypothetical protein